MNKIKTKRKILISIVTLFINLYCVFIFANMYNSNYSPTSSKVDIQPILSNPALTSANYSLLYSQTGLSKQAIEDLRVEKNGNSEILAFQNTYFSKKKLYFEKLNPFTIQESLMVNGTVNNKGFQIAPLKNGDILLTKSTYTLYWRHGHCGIVIDAKNGITLESLEPGTISMQQNISKWESYSTFKLMRLKDVDQKKLDDIAKYAAQNLLGVKYNIFASKKHDSELKYENCSQLIYQAFIHFGYDIDSNKGIFVTPEDIAKSKLLSIVQIYGFNPKADW